MPQRPPSTSGRSPHSPPSISVTHRTRMPHSRYYRFVRLPFAHRRHPSSRSPHSITFISRCRWAGHNDNTVITSDTFAKGMSLRTTSGTGDRTAVQIRAKGLRDYESERIRWGRKSKREGRYCEQGKKHEGVEIAHFRRGDGIEMIYCR